MNTAISARHYSNLATFAADPINADDERWFRAHWSRKHRMRPPGQLELAAIPKHRRPTSGHLAYILVRQLAPGTRVRTFDWSIEYEPDNEAFCRRAFEAAWRKLAPDLPAPSAKSKREWRA